MVLKSDISCRISLVCYSFQWIRPLCSAFAPGKTILVDCRFSPSSDDILQCCCRLASNANICRRTLFNIVACAIRGSKTFFRPSFTHGWYERNGISGCIIESPRYIQTTLYGHSYGKHGRLSHGIPSCSASKYSAVMVLSWLTRVDRSYYSGILLCCSGNSRRGFVGEAPGKTINSRNFDAHPGLTVILNALCDAPGYFLQNPALLKKQPYSRGVFSYWMLLPWI